MAVKNMWSLTVDEALVVTEMKKQLGKPYEMFIPTNSRLEDIDIVLMNMEAIEPITIQIKGSRTWEVTEKVRSEYGDGAVAWIQITHKAIYKPHYRTDFFVLVLHNLFDGNNKKQIKLNYLIIPAAELGNRICSQKVLSKKKSGGSLYNFYILVNDEKGTAIDVRDCPIDFSDFLDNWDILRNKEIH